MEPYNLRPWRLDAAPKGEATFYTCARPGRAAGPDGAVEDHTVSTWVKELPGPNKAIISLLGRKHGLNGISEFSYYSFCGGMDTETERGDKPIFQEWLDQWHSDLEILLIEHPTYDYQEVPLDALEAVGQDLCDLISQGRTVVVMDSGGVGRVGEVCEFLKATPV